MFSLELPEIQIHDSERAELFDIHSEYKKNEIQFVAQSGDICDLWLMSDYVRSPLIHRLESKVKHVRNSYFLRNKGTYRHRDHLRLTVISFVLQDPARIPTTIFADDEETKVGEIFYTPNMPVLWDVSQIHEVPHPSPERIFFQMEMDRSYRFDYYVEMYNNGELFRW